MLIVLKIVMNLHLLLKFSFSGYREWCWAVDVVTFQSDYLLCLTP